MEQQRQREAGKRKSLAKSLRSGEEEDEEVGAGEWRGERDGAKSEVEKRDKAVRRERGSDSVRKRGGWEERGM